MRVVVTRDGRIFLGNAGILPGDLQNRLQEGVRSGSERRVYVSVDSRTRYSELSPVLDGIRQAGIAKITFITQGRPHS